MLSQTATDARLLDRIKQLAGFDDTNEAERVMDIVVRAFSESLGSDDAKVDVDDFFERVSKGEGTTIGFAREHSEAVCRALAERLSDADLSKLQEWLPGPFAELFRRPATEGEPPPHAVSSSSRHHTLATGRLGSLHATSDSRPAGAQAHSVAREDNPHADTKLSSAPGTTQERLNESLATAQPSSRRSIGDRRD